MIAISFLVATRVVLGSANGGGFQAPLQSEAGCQQNTQPCSGYSQDQGNAQCCSGYCHLLNFNRHTGHMTGLCEEECYLDGQGCFGYSQIEADAQCCSGHCDVLSVDSYGGHHGKCQPKTTASVPAADPIEAPAPVANPIGVEHHCQHNTRPCSGYTQDQGNAQCCSGYCHLMEVNEHTGFMQGLCEEQCYLVHQPCFGNSQYEADAQCCSGSCDVLSIDSDGGHHGECQPKSASEATRRLSGSAPAPAADPNTPAQSCQRNTQPCSGYSQDQGNAQCCSGYCHLMEVNEHTGFMTGLCEEQCFLNNQSCFGYSTYEADAQCCSGHCDVLSIDTFGGHHGKCQPKASPAPTPCQPLEATCAGRTFTEADNECCSKNCNNLTLLHGVYYGTCEL